MLFLTRFDLPHGGVWTRWFASAAGLAPLATLRADWDAGAQRRLTRMLTACDVQMTPAEAMKRPVEEIISLQNLFSVYVHVPPGLSGGHGHGMSLGPREGGPLRHAARTALAG